MTIASDTLEDGAAAVEPTTDPASAATGFGIPELAPSGNPANPIRRAILAALAHPGANPDATVTDSRTEHDPLEENWIDLRDRNTDGVRFWFGADDQLVQVQLTTGNGR